MSPIVSQPSKSSEPVTSTQAPRARERREKPTRDLYLPKPVPPSQHYLEGRTQSTPFGSRSLPSPRSLYLQKEAEVADQEVHQKKRSMNTRKMYKNLSPESVPAMPMVPSAQTFNLDIPENKSTMTTWNRTFIPMQLRTQPPTYPRASSRG